LDMDHEGEYAVSRFAVNVIFSSILTENLAKFPNFRRDC
jgi:hypothetical protein